MALDGAPRFPEGSAEPVLLCAVDMDTTASVLRLHGELDVESAALLIAVVDGQITQHHVDLRTDLTGLTFCDVRGIDALVHVQRRLRQAGGRLVVHGASDFLKRTAHLCGADRLFEGAP